MKFLTIITSIISPFTPSVPSFFPSSPNFIPASHMYSVHDSVSSTHHFQNSLLRTSEIGTFGLVAIRSGTDFHNQAISASGQRFWIGKKTTSYCPSQVGNICPSGKDTYFTGGDGHLGLGVIVPGGQLVFIAPDGALGFTQAHSGYIPPGSIVDGFSVDGGYLYWENGFSACPVEEGIWQIFANVDDLEGEGCTGILTQIMETEGFGAWQYV